MRIDKIDKIILTYNEYQEISTWVQAQNFDSVDITLNEGFIIMNDIQYKGFAMNMGIYFRIDQATGDILVQQYDIDDMKVLISGTVDEEFFRNGKIHIDVKEDRWKRFLKQEDLESNIKITILTILDIFQYMNHYRENVVIEEHTKKVRKAPRHNAKKKKSNVVPLKTKQYSFRNTKTTKEGYKYNRHKEVWSVKGHWRHYKDGRKVWIKPHNRGLGEVQEGKVYKAN
jgi:nitrogen regulatory protein PII-like uncharacterized protein